jgi:tetratricopeptide (TPR) repeat protein
MVASCYRRSGNYRGALDAYKRIHRQFPDNIECLRFLVRLCTDMGLPEVQEYVASLQRAERAREAREQMQRVGASILLSLISLWLSFEYSPNHKDLQPPSLAVA